MSTTCYIVCNETWRLLPQTSRIWVQCPGLPSSSGQCSFPVTIIDGVYFKKQNKKKLHKPGVFGFSETVCIYTVINLRAKKKDQEVSFHPASSYPRWSGVLTHSGTFSCSIPFSSPKQQRRFRSNLGTNSMCGIIKQVYVPSPVH